MNLKEIKSLLDNKVIEVRELTRKRNEFLFNQYRFVQGSDIDFNDKYQVNAPHEFSVDELTEDINRLDEEILLLKSTLNRHNESTIIEFKGNKMSLSTAIFKVKTMRDKLPSLKKLGEIKESRDLLVPNKYSDETQTYLVINKPTYDVKQYRDLAKVVENDIISLQSLIDKANLETNVLIEL